MGWLTDLLSGRNDRLTFEQDLELFCARWMDRSRKGEHALTVRTLSTALQVKAETLLDRPIPPIRSGQGA